MGTTERASLEIKLSYQQQSTNPHPNEIIPGGYTLREALPNGDGDNKIKVIGAARVSIGAASTTTIDLKADLDDPNHDPVTTMAEVRMAMLIASPTNDATVTVEAAAANGNTLFGANGAGTPLPPGSVRTVYIPTNDDHPVTAGAKDLLFSNSAGAQSNIVRVIMLGTE